MSREPSFPIFVQSEYEPLVMKMLNSDELACSYEQNDVEGEEYRGWDSDGYPLRLIWRKHQGIQIEMTGEDPCTDRMREAILGTSRIPSREPAFDAEQAPKDAVELFRAIEKWELDTRPPGLIERLRRMFGRTKN